MKRSPLFQIYFVYHESDASDVLPYKTALTRAFEYIRPDRTASDLDPIPDVWERVQFRSISDGAAWSEAEAADDPAIPTLFVVMVTEMLVNDTTMRDILDAIAALLPLRLDEGNCELLAYSLSQQAKKKVPPAFASRQVESLERLGEDRIAPHKLGLVALHRARMLMGETRRSEKLRIFISHAKFDGIFLAQSIKSAIDQVPELSVWYDAKDIEGGSDWLTGIQDAASTCVFIAVRTNTYEQRKICREEFMLALLNGVPIVVVDALMQPVSDSSPLPFSAVPNVRIQDGNTYRVLLTTLREHLRLLLMQASALELTSSGLRPRVWPRLPSPAAIRKAWTASNTNEFWLVPKALCYDAEFLELRDWLVASKARIALDHLETFRPPPSLS
jgi:hypothetical protein